MTAARTFKYVNRLAKALTQHSGLTMREAVKAADARLAQLRENTLTEIDGIVLRIQALSQDITRLDDPRVQQVYGAANQIIALAGVFEKTELGEAAYSLCELITRFRNTGRWSAAMVAVHVDALQVMRQVQDHDPAHCTALKHGLRKVVESVA
ncbi:hypothetical protein ACO2Q0_07735 [Phenylobacterium sp. VNQ135]|uniref:hypothetical protein n=1 Tax=Phenylobacterium sp. VNQ135 TaxID=3400922 RepID=UPI003BFC0705